MKTKMRILLSSCLLLCAIAPLRSTAQSPAPPPDTILKEISTGETPAPPSDLDPLPSDLRSSGRLDEKAPGPWDAGAWTISPFASYRAHELGEFDGRFGGGLAVSYAPVDNIAIELETLSETWRTDPWIDSLEEAGVNFKGYLPFGSTGLAGYGFIGYTRALRQDQNRMNAGAGIEVRAEQVYAFADGRWADDFSEPVHFLFRIGGGVHF